MNPAAVARFLLAACFLVLLFNAGARFAIGLLLHPMAEDLEWSRSMLSLNVTVFMVLAASLLPLVGWAVDRIGAPAVLSASVLVSALGLAAMGFIQHPWQALLFYGVVIGIGSAGTSITPVSVLLSRWYPHWLGMANSIAISGMGIGQLLVISVLTAQLAVLGWRGSFLALGAATVICVLPLILLGGKASAPPPDPRAGQRAGTLRETFGSQRFRLLLVVYAICGFQDFLVATHIVAYALDKGTSALLAGNMFAFMGLAGLAGVLLAGWLNDRFGPVLPTAACFVVRIAFSVLVLASPEPIAIVVAALLFGLTFWVTAPLTVVFAREVAAAGLLGTVAGFITMIHHMAGGFGALVGASLFDAFGSYRSAFAAMLVLSVIALALTLLLPRAPAGRSAP